MSCFKVPLPFVRRQKLNVNDNAINGLCDFKRNDYSNFTLIGKGSFGKVYKCSKDNNEFVLKECDDEVNER